MSFAIANCRLPIADGLATGQSFLFNRQSAIGNPQS